MCCSDMDPLLSVALGLLSAVMSVECCFVCCLFIECCDVCFVCCLLIECCFALLSEKRTNEPYERYCPIEIEPLISQEYCYAC